MSLLFTDGLHTYSSISDLDTINSGPWELVNSAHLELLPNGGQEGQPCVQFQPDQDDPVILLSDDVYCHMGLPWTHRQNNNIVGFMFKLDSWPSYALDTVFHNIVCAQAREDPAYYGISLGFYNTGEIGVHSQGDGSRYRSGFFIVPGVWYHISFKFGVFNPPDGVAQVRVNGGLILNLGAAEGFDGYYTYTTDQEKIMFGLNENISSNPYGMTYRISDIYVQDDLNGELDDHLSRDTRVTYLPVESEGANIDFTPTTGTNNALMLDEIVKHDHDTTRNRSSSVGAKDLFNVASLNFPTGEIFGMNVRMVANKGSATARTMNLIQYSNGSEEVSSSLTLTQDYEEYNASFSINPDTGLTWTIAEFANAQIGYKVET